MASATTKISFTCPNCAKVLRSSTRPPAGKKVKCPACGEPFVPELDEEEAEATAIQSKPGSKAKAAPRDDDDEDAKPRSKKNRADDDDDGDDEKPRGKKKRADEDEEEDDRPVKKKKAKKKSGSGMLLMVGGLVVLGGGALLSCALCGVGAFVWPGFLTSKKSNLEAFVPPDANLVMGGNPKMLKTKAAELEKIIRLQGMQQKNANEELEFSNSEQVLMFGNTRNLMGNQFTIVCVASQADIDKLKRNPGIGAPQTLGGHNNVHKVTDQGRMNGVSYDYVAFTSNNIVVMSNGDQQSFIATLDRGKKPAQPNAALDLSRSVDRSHFWIAMTLDANMRDDLKRGMGQKGPMMPAAIGNAIPAVDGIKGVTVTIDIADNQDIKIAANVPCNNADDATKVKVAAEDGWNQVKALLQLGLAFQQPGQEKVPQAFVKDLTSIEFVTQGSTATAKMKLTSQAIQELAQLAGKQRNFGPGPGPIAPPPPPPFPGPNPQPPFPNPPGPFPPGPFPPGPNGPNLQPPPGAKLIATFTHNNLAPGGQAFNTIKLQQGKAYTAIMVSTIANNQQADVDLIIRRGKNEIASDTTVGPNGRVTFVATISAIHIVAVENLGPAVASSSVVKLYEH
jgi:hypothetical protein